MQRYQNQMATVFFSYSHKDEDLRDRLEAHLAPLIRQGFIESWHDRRITAGDDFAGKIDENLNKADIILLLLSSDFLGSGYCYDVETARALERHDNKEARVIPVILRPCLWHGTPLGKLLAAPKDGKAVVLWPNQDEAFLDVAKMIQDALPSTKTKAKPITKAEPIQAEKTETEPRSSNLRVKKTFTEAQRDRFAEDAFEYLAKFFSNSLEELRVRNEGFDCSFRRLDSNHFTAVIYKNGQAESRCKIGLGGMMRGGITYSISDQPRDNSMNEGLSVKADDQCLYFEAMGMPMSNHKNINHLSEQGAAEYLWSLLMERIQ